MSNPETPGDTTPEDAAEPRLASIEPTPSAELSTPAPAATPFDDPFGTDEPTAKIEPPPLT